MTELTEVETCIIQTQAGLVGPAASSVNLLVMAGFRNRSGGFAGCRRLHEQQGNSHSNVVSIRALAHTEFLSVGISLS